MASREVEAELARLGKMTNPLKKLEACDRAQTEDIPRLQSGIADLRAEAITELLETINPATGKKWTLQGIADKEGTTRQAIHQIVQRVKGNRAVPAAAAAAG